MVTINQILSESDTNILLNILAGNREKLSEVERIKAEKKIASLNPVSIS
mgnify:CR=1 FL=1